MDPAEGFAPRQRSSAEERFHKESARKANDTIRVYNPTNKDYFIIWDGYKHRVPAKGTLDCPRYIAMTYRRDMVVQLINELADVKRLEWKEKRDKDGKAPLSFYEMNLELFPNEPRTDNQELVTAFSKQIWLGVVKEFGLDDVTPQMQMGQVDLRTLEDKVMEELDTLRVSPLETDPAPVLTPTDKKKLAQEITADA